MNPKNPYIRRDGRLCPTAKPQKMVADRIICPNKNPYICRDGRLCPSAPRHTNKGIVYFLLYRVKYI